MAINLTPDENVPETPDTSSKPEVIDAEIVPAEAAPLAPALPQVPERTPIPQPTIQEADDTWIWPSSGAKGESEHFSFRGVPILRHWINELLHKRSFPYTSESDLLRHAAHRHVAFLLQYRHCPKGVGTIINSMAIALQDEAYQQAFAESMATTEKLVNNAIAMGNFRSAEKLVQSLWNTLQGMDDQDWKRHYSTVFRNKFGKFIKN